MEGKVPFWLVEDHTGTRPNLKLSGIWTKQTQITTTKPQILREKHFTVGIAKRFRLRILSYTIPYEFNILQLLSGQRRNMNNVCQFISDHLMNEYIQDCDYKAVSLNETKIWNEVEIPIWTIQVQNPDLDWWNGAPQGKCSMLSLLIWAKQNHFKTLYLVEGLKMSYFDDLNINQTQQPVQYWIIFSSID